MFALGRTATAAHVDAQRSLRASASSFEVGISSPRILIVS